MAFFHVVKGGNTITLEQFFKENPSAALGFSGGVDSSYVLYAAIKYGAKIRAYHAKTAFQPDFEMRDACLMAQHLGADMTILEEDVLAIPQVVSNPADRCYHCKKAIFGALHRQAQADGFTLIIDGTNASDDADDRPGMRATAELSVRSPLRECGITKDEVRRLSKEAGLFTWDKPAYACLATRIPTGRAYTPELLQKVEQSEDALRGLGFSDFRVRVMGEAAKLQFPQDQMMKAIAEKADIIEAIKPHFSTILLDLEGR